MVFETLLKRADADYYVAFQYFDVCALFSSTLRPTVTRFNGKGAPTVTAPERSHSTSSRTSSKPTSNRMLSPSISIGASFAWSFLRIVNNVLSTHSDWVKLYLGTKNGTHVLGCMRLFPDIDYPFD